VPPAHAACPRALSEPKSCQQQQNYIPGCSRGSFLCLAHGRWRNLLLEVPVDLTLVWKEKDVQRPSENGYLDDMTDLRDRVYSVRSEMTSFDFTAPSWARHSALLCLWQGCMSRPRLHSKMHYRPQAAERNTSACVYGEGRPVSGTTPLTDHAATAHVVAN
jgi:hypothetical protein